MSERSKDRIKSVGVQKYYDLRSCIFFLFWLKLCLSPLFSVACFHFPWLTSASSFVSLVFVSFLFLFRVLVLLLFNVYFSFVFLLLLLLGYTEHIFLHEKQKTFFFLVLRILPKFYLQIDGLYYKHKLGLSLECDL